MRRRPAGSPHQHSSPPKRRSGTSPGRSPSSPLQCGARAKRARLRATRRAQGRATAGLLPHHPFCCLRDADTGAPGVGMHQVWAVAFMILCSAVGSVSAEEKKPANAIRVLEATYGGNCAGVAKGNVTKFIASACDGTDLCNYRVYYKNMDDDPAAGCKKAFRVTYV